MLNILRDSIWQFIGAVLAIVAIAISVAIFLLQRNRKEISYEIISKTPLLSVAKEVEKKLEILFEGEPVKGVNLILLRISNTGNVPILPADFLQPVNIAFDSDAKILSAEITDRKPKSIDSIVNINVANVSISPSLLNGGDSIVVKILVSEFDGSIEILGRIVGVKDIKRSGSEMSVSSALLIFLGTILIYTGLGLAIVANKPLYGFSSVGLGSVTLLIPISYDRKAREFMIHVWQVALKASVLPR